MNWCPSVYAPTLSSPAVPCAGKVPLGGGTETGRRPPKALADCDSTKALHVHLVKCVVSHFCPLVVECGVAFPITQPNSGKRDTRSFRLAVLTFLQRGCNQVWPTNVQLFQKN